jgi:hypothetical protein
LVVAWCPRSPTVSFVPAVNSIIRSPRRSYSTRVSQSSGTKAALAGNAGSRERKALLDDLKWRCELEAGVRITSQDLRRVTGYRPREQTLSMAQCWRTEGTVPSGSQVAHARICSEGTLTQVQAKAAVNWQRLIALACPSAQRALEARQASSLRYSGVIFANRLAPTR